MKTSFNNIPKSKQMDIQKFTEAYKQVITESTNDSELRNYIRSIVEEVIKEMTSFNNEEELDKQYINEIFDNPYDYTILTYSKYHYSGYFLTEEEKLFSVDVVEKENKVAEVGFNAHPDYKSEMLTFFDLTPPFNEDSFIEYFEAGVGIPTDKKLDIDTKDVSRIFATVIKIVEEYYDRFKPDTLFFRAKNSEANRVTLYYKIAKRFAKKYNLELVTKTHTESTMFALNKR